MNETNQKEIKNFLEYIKSQKGLSKNTLINYEIDLVKFVEYLEKENLTFETLKRYHFRGFLQDLNRQKMSKSSINRLISAIRGFVKYKIRYGYKDVGNILEVESLKTEQYLPKFLFDNEFQKLIDFNMTNREDYRDKAIFELIFSTGLRVSEVVSLNLSHINNNKDLRIIGKGNKERVVLYGETANKLIGEYLTKRSEFKPKDDALFLNHQGRRLSDRGIRYILEKRIDEISFQKKISPHSLRHSFATHMIRNGANIKSVQLLLGHASLSSTQIYTHFDLDKLKEMHFNYHPHGKES